MVRHVTFGYLISMMSSCMKIVWKLLVILFTDGGDYEWSMWDGVVNACLMWYFYYVGLRYHTRLHTSLVSLLSCFSTNRKNSMPRAYVVRNIEVVLIRRESEVGSLFQRWGHVYRNELSIIFIEKLVGGQEWRQRKCEYSRGVGERLDYTGRMVECLWEFYV